MYRRLLCILTALLFAVAVSACAENEYKVTDKKEIQTESPPTDVSPGEMIVE
ncbi:MAG TPA: hypothetical protein VMV94_15700 [Phycisphaerae bacterium]|nr:hypothetical protein [Phycisphaerae bacterium]